MGEFAQGAGGPGVDLQVWGEGGGGGGGGGEFVESGDGELVVKFFLVGENLGVGMWYRWKEPIR